MKFFQLILKILIPLFLLVHSSIIFTHSGLLLMQKVTPSFYAISYMLLILFILIGFVAGMLKRSIRQNILFTLFCSASVILMAVSLFWFVLDDPPLDHDYTTEDVIQKANGSYAYLEFFNKADIKILKKANQKIGESYKGKIAIKAFDEVWEDIAEYRHAIAALDNFNVICDLPEDEKLDVNYSILHITALKEVSNIYRKYFLLKLSLGKGKKAAIDFSRLYRVARKGMNDSTLLINKMIFTSIADKIMDTAYVAATNKKCDKQTLLILKENFSVLNLEELSLKRPVKAEYVILKNTMKELVSPATFLEDFTTPPPYPGKNNVEKKTNGFAPASYLAYYLSYKPNRSLRKIKTYYDLLIKAQGKFPIKTASADLYFKEYRNHPPLRNMVGWILNSIASPNLEIYYSRVEKIKVKSELLSLTIHKKLELPFEVKDFYTKGSYNYREKPEFLKHPGKDGKYETQDDIILGVRSP